MADHNKKDDQVPADYQRLEGSERRPRRGARLVGPADLTETISVSIYVRQKPGAAPLPDQQHWAKTPPGQRKFMTREDLAASHGAAQEDLDKVIRFARSQGLHIDQTSVARQVVVVSGTVEQVSRAFSVTLGHYETPSEKYRGREGFIHLPKDLTGVVTGVFGLDNRRMARRGSNGGPPGASALTPPQVASLYNFPTGKATGQTIGIFEFSGPTTGSNPQLTCGYKMADINAFFSGLGQSTPNIHAVSVDSATNTPNGDPYNSGDGEVVLDIDVAGSVGQGANLAVYFAPLTEQGWVDIVTTAILDSTSLPAGWALPSVISCSWGWAELEADAPAGNTSDPWAFEWTQAAITLVTATYQKAAAMGVTVFNCTFDNGSNEYERDGKAHVAYPATDPWITACGGTIIKNVVGSTFTENTWNDDAYQTGSATGGGISDVFAMPSWQNGAVTIPSVNDSTHFGRGIPDVAGNASAYSGYVLQVDGVNPFQEGGTSAVAPLYAGLVAIMNAALGEPIGYLNPTLYALALQPGGTDALRDINDGISNSVHWVNTDSSIGGPSAGYKSGPGWDACTGLGVINGGALFSALKTLYQKSMSFIMQRTTFGKDEVQAATGGAFQQAFFVTVDGLKPSDFPGGGITTLTPTTAQLNQWAPAIPMPSGPAGATNITIAPTSVSSDDPSLGPEVQLFTFTYSVTFPDLTAFTTPPAADFPETLTLTASLPASTGVPPASTQIELILAADPFFSSESNGGLYWLSEDIRVFYAVEGSKLFGAPALGSTLSDAQAFIQWIISNIEGPLGTGPNGDTFESTLSNQESAAISLLPVTLDSPPRNIYNFAIARVRLNGLSEKAKTVRAFFRLFQSQSVAVPYQAPVNANGPSAPTGAYRQWSDGIDEGQKIPLLGISSDGSEYITVPCFAGPRATNTSTATNMTTQTDSANVQPMTPIMGQTVYAYFGCVLDNNNQSSLVFPMAPGADPDGPFTGQPLFTVSQVLDRGGHQCIIVQIVDDDAPILNNATPGSSDKIAQRNLAFTTVANPGLTDSRLATHTFEIRPSPFTLNSDERPDELMIDWGNVPSGSVASIYLPTVQAADVLALAARMYTVHNLSSTDAHTIQCSTGGTTYIPIPQGSGPNHAGLFSVQLPLGIKHGQEFHIVVRQITSSFRNLEVNKEAVIGTVIGAAVLVRSRFVYGSFQISIPVSVKSDMLVPEERNLSVLRWIQQTIPATSRWYPVFQRYIAQLSGRVTALGGDGSTVPPTPTGIWPGLPGSGKGTGKGSGHAPHDHMAYTGKVDGIVYDHFGDVEAFLLETFEGERRRFDSHEPSVLKLVQRAWAHRILTTVVVRHDHPKRPLEIILHGVPPLSEE